MLYRDACRAERKIATAREIFLSTAKVRTNQFAEEHHKYIFVYERFKFETLS